ncbi:MULTISPECIES: glucarate dehydratase family protein [Actinoalloteichus]|uniref:glucarate dehydratase n=1 Tax=Actinoalloteichus fjordicus TaxID=1612552 RepID=A0AAC9LGR2_9PSEU|nr:MULTISPECIES: glucarate dehydratase family protein [Actinoalloteichus]APU16560.1 enolase superfamily enzyme related to L-alanine-DL-glutamate epimerase [Actinoalloteichus fjordicus]APU22627.1 enolase superfamily enzyme related to L-alanine-DL-glutamate epimerase [Actinoalloteichus sp. GBA129-24]
MPESVTTEPHRIREVRVTPVAFRDLPLLNVVGVHEPFALRAIIEIVTDSGLVGLGETYGDAGHLDRIRLAAAQLIDVDVWDVNEIARRVHATLAADTSKAGHGMSGMVTGSSTADRVLSPFEVACLDIQGHAIGRPVSDLLGGAVRDRVDYSAYLFYKWAGHPGGAEDQWGAALDPDQLVAQARRMIDEYGFSAIKLKGGVFPPEEEIEAIRALRRAFPDYPLRIDPNGAWTVETSIRVGKELDGVLEYLEDPTPGIEGMASVAREVSMPLATNMCVVAFDHVKPAVAQDAVGVILSDHHFWGGLGRSRVLAGICDTFGMGLSMHSNSHLGISLAAMTHLAAATPNLNYACDTHWPWKSADDDVVVPGVLRFEQGAVPVPTGPGLGVELDRDALARLHEQYLSSGIRERDDTGYMRRVQPDFDPTAPRW